MRKGQRRESGLVLRSRSTIHELEENLGPRVFSPSATAEGQRKEVSASLLIVLLIPHVTHQCSLPSGNKGVSSIPLQGYLEVLLQSQIGWNCWSKGGSFPFSRWELRKQWFTKPFSDKVFSSTHDWSRRSGHTHHMAMQPAHPKHRAIGRPQMLYARKARAQESCNGVTEAMEGLTARNSSIWISHGSPICLITA